MKLLRNKMEFSSAIYRGDPCPEFSFSFKLLVLRRLIVFDMKATVMEHSKIITDRVAGDLKGIIFFEDLHQLSCR